MAAELQRPEIVAAGHDSAGAGGNAGEQIGAEPAQGHADDGQSWWRSAWRPTRPVSSIWRFPSRPRPSSCPAIPSPSTRRRMKKPIDAALGYQPVTSQFSTYSMEVLRHAGEGAGRDQGRRRHLARPQPGACLYRHELCQASCAGRYSDAAGRLRQRPDQDRLSYRRRGEPGVARGPDGSAGHGHSDRQMGQGLDGRPQSRSPRYWPDAGETDDVRTLSAGLLHHGRTAAPATLPLGGALGARLCRRQV